MARIPSWIAMEELSTDMSEVSVPELAEMPAETAESAELEAAADNRALDEAITDSQDLSADMDTVGDIKDAVEGSEIVSDATAQVTDVAVESYCNKWCVPYRKVATESRNNNKQELLYALESSDGSLWERFMELITGIINRIREAWKNFTNAGKTIQKRSEKLKKAVEEKVKDGKTAEGEISGGWINGLVVDGKVELDGVIEKAKNSENIVKTSTALVGEIVDLAGEAVEMSDARKEIIEKHVESSAGFFETFVDTIFGRIPSARMEYISAEAKDATNLRQAALPGNIYLTSYFLGAKNMLGGKAIGGPGIAIPYVIQSQGKELKDAKLKPGDRSKLLSACESLKALGVSMEKDILNFRESEKKMSDLKAALLKARKDRDSGVASNQRIKIARQSMINAALVTRVVGTVRTNMAKGLMGYVAESVKAYK